MKKQNNNKRTPYTYYNMSYEDIAKKIGVSKNGARKIALRALHKLSEDRKLINLYESLGGCFE